METVDNTISDCSVIGEHALNILAEVLIKDETISEEAILNLISEQLKEKKDALAKNVRAKFKKLVDKIRKLEVQAIQKLDQMV